MRLGFGYFVASMAYFWHPMNEEPQTSFRASVSAAFKYLPTYVGIALLLAGIVLFSVSCAVESRISMGLLFLTPG